MPWQAASPFSAVQSPGWVATMGNPPAEVRSDLNPAVHVVFSRKPDAPVMMATLPPDGRACLASDASRWPTSSALSFMVNDNLLYGTLVGPVPTEPCTEAIGMPAVAALSTMDCAGPGEFGTIK